MPRALSQLLLISRHAMQQASGLFATRLARLWQEIHWGSLLTLAPVWALATAHPQLLESWQQRVQVYGLGRCSSEVEEELLGMPLLPICRALADRWRLPQWVIQGYRPAQRRQAPAGARPARRPHRTRAAGPATAPGCPSGSRPLADPPGQHHPPGQRPGHGRTPELGRAAHAALAAPDQPLPGPDAAGRIAADRPRPRRAQRPPPRPPAALAPGAGVALALGCAPLAQRAEGRGAGQGAGHPRRMAPALHPPDADAQPVQQRRATARLCHALPCRPAACKGCSCWWPIAPRYAAAGCRRAATSAWTARSASSSWKSPPARCCANSCNNPDNCA